MLGLISEAAIFSISTISRLRNNRETRPLEITIEQSPRNNIQNESEELPVNENEIPDRESLLKAKIINIWKSNDDPRKDSILTDLPSFQNSDANSKIKKLWKLESRKALRKSESDSWADIFENLEPYKASRLRYNATKETWLEDKIQIKIESKTFNEGKFSEKSKWMSQNY